MATYVVMPRQRQSGFKIEIVGDDGVRNTILGLASEAEAEAWIIEDRRESARKHESSSRPAWRGPLIASRHLNARL
jgi:hypothetical protein